jgi:uncharacterized protein (DUF488 family)
LEEKLCYIFVAIYYRGGENKIMRIYTLGYQGLNPEIYIQSLINAGVKVVIDVRENSWSQRPAYVGSTLKRALEPAGISYQHWKALGNPSANRKTASSAAECMRRYRSYLKENRENLLLFLTEMVDAASNGNPICLTCYEKEHRNCHRSVIVDELIKIEPSIIPIHLEPSSPAKPTRIKRKVSSSSRARKSPAFLPFS